MNRRTRLPLAAAALALVLGCRGDALSPPDGPMFAVSDGAHGGLSSFFFLPPLFKMPTVHPGTFNPDLRPSVEICDLGIRPTVTPPPPRDCVSGVDPVALFPASSVTVSVAEEQYQVNWHTDESALLLDHDYRIRVLVGGAELGFADVDPVTNGSQLKNVQTNEYIGLVDGRTLPIKFRIEDGALCGGGTGACSAATVDLATGGTVELVVTENGVVTEIFEVTVEAGTTAQFGGQAVTDVTINIEECEGGGIDLDLRPFGRCVQVTTFFTETGGEGGRELALSNERVEFPLVISTCRLESSPDLAALSEAEEAYITLHQQDGLTVRALSHVHPHCDVISRLNAAPAGFVQRGLRRLGTFASRMFLPQTLHAGSRSAVINLGAGGGTRVLGTDCTSVPAPSARGMLLAECAGTPQPSAPMGVSAAVVGAAKTVSKFQFFQPAIMTRDDGTNGLSALVDAAVSDPPRVTVVDAENPGVAVVGATVTFAVTAGNGNFGMDGTTPIRSIAVQTNSDGVAQVPTWVLGSEPGTNTVQARGRGLAARPGDLKPFVPEILGVNTAVELPTPTDAHFVEFTATGSGANLIIFSFSRSFTTPTVADDITFTAVVKNDGTGPAPASRMSLRVGGETFPPSFAVPALAGGATFTVTRTLNLDVAQGYIAEAKADINNDVGETIETDNNLLMTFVLTALTTAISDGTGDAVTDSRVEVAPDLTSASARVDRGNLTLQLRFATGTFDATTTMATVVIDIDQNPATGFAGVDGANNDAALIGAEYNLEVGSESVGATATLFTFSGGGFSTQKVGAITYVAGGADVVLPLSALGGDRGELSFKILVQTQIGFPPDGVAFTGIVDYMTNLGSAPGSLVAHPIVIGLATPPRYLASGSGESGR